MRGEVREQWLKLCGRGGGKMEQEVRALWWELHEDVRGELEITVWDPWPELYGQGWGRLNLRSHGPVAGAVDREEDDDRIGHQEPMTGDVWIKKNTVGETVRLLEPQLCRQGATIGHSVVRQVVG